MQLGSITKSQLPAEAEGYNKRHNFMRYTVRAQLTVLWLIFLLSRSLSAQETIHWLQDDFPPYMFAAKELLGDGLCDTAFLKVQEVLSPYDNVTHTVSLTRFLKMMKSKSAYCYSCLLKNQDREEFIVFSKPYSYLAGNELVTRSEDASLYQPYLDEDGSIDLEKLLHSGQIILSITYGRSYGAHIDTILSSYKGTSAINSAGGQSSQELMVRRLFTLKAYHAILGYAPEMLWHSKKLGLDMEQLKLYPILGLETFDPRSFVYFGCSKGKLGEKIIRTIDAHIYMIRKAALKSYRQWLDDNTRKRHEAHESVFYRENP